MNDEAVTPSPASDGAPEDAAEQLERVGVLRVGKVRLGVEGRYCSGLIEVSRPTPLPRSAAYVLGVLMIRGTIVPLLDAGELLGIERSGPYAAGLVVSSGGSTGVLATDEMVAFERLDVGGLSPANGSVPTRMRSFSRGLLTVGEAQLVVLDVPSLFAVFRAPPDAADARSL